MKKSLLPAFIMLLWSVLLLTACDTQEGVVTPVEEEQIQNVVEEFVVRNTEVPEYEVTIEEIDNGWARVSVNPAGVEGGETTLYLQKQTGVEDAPTAVVAEIPGNEGRAGTTTGWAIILGPQAEYSQAQLDEVGVPAEVRPE